MGPGDIVVVRSGAYTGDSAIVTPDWAGAIAGFDMVVRVRPGCLPRFVAFSLLSKYILEGQINLLRMRAAQPHLNAEELGEIAFVKPSLTEQSAIAAFLDRETGKIDALVAEQERLMALLKEKRQAVISQSVIKGLNPNAKMKPSGVEWLGDVPAHWTVAPLRYVARIGNGSTPNRENPTYWQDGSYPWLTSSHVNRDYIENSTEFVTPTALAECHLPRITPPAVLIGITGQGRTRGMASVLCIEATISQHIAFAKPDETRLLAGFLRRVIDHLYEFLRLESEGGGSTKGAITCEQLAGVRIVIPAVEEQLEIGNFIDSELAKLDTLTAEAIHVITLLKERRAALISAAVTGKIDVRAFADAAQAAA